MPDDDQAASGDDQATGPPPSHDPLRWWLDACSGSPRHESSLSLEIRWFGQGDPPTEVAAVTAGGRTETRTDRYAVLGRDDVSIKLRGRTRLGIKQRRCRVAVADGLPPAERWSRRSGRTPGGWLPHGPSWLAVSKRRARLFVDLSGAEPVVATGRRAQITRGGAVEVVQLVVPGRQRLWSAACETWGPADREGMARLLEWPGVDWAALDRDAWFSGGYPAALNRWGPATG